MKYVELSRWKEWCKGSNGLAVFKYELFAFTLKYR